MSLPQTHFYMKMLYVINLSVVLPEPQCSADFVLMTKDLKRISQELMKKLRMLRPWGHGLKKTAISH